MEELKSNNELDFSEITEDQILSIEICDIKGVELVKVNNADDIVEFAGDNGAGKTSALDACLYAFGGAKFIGEKPLRDGEEEGYIKITTKRGVFVHRVFRENKGTNLYAKGPNGKKIGQTQLNEFFGEFAFDPLAFKTLPLEKQLKIYRQIVGEESCKQYDDLTEKYNEKYKERTFINQQLSKLGNLPAMEKVDPVDTSELVEEMRSATKFNKEIDDQHRRQQIAVEELARLHNQIAALERELEEKKRLLEAQKKNIAELPPISQQKDIEAINNKIIEASTQNRRSQEYQQYLIEVEKRANIAAQSNALTEELKEIDAEREAVAKKMKFPIEGVRFSSSGIRVNNIPFSELCGKEQLDIAIEIGIALNKKMKVMFIHHGEALDNKSFAELGEKLMKRGYQLITATVGQGHNPSYRYILSDGKILVTPEPKKETAVSELGF